MGGVTHECHVPHFELYFPRRNGGCLIKNLYSLSHFLCCCGEEAIMYWYILIGGWLLDQNPSLDWMVLRPCDFVEVKLRPTVDLDDCGWYSGRRPAPNQTPINQTVLVFLGHQIKPCFVEAHHVQRIMLRHVGDPIQWVWAKSKTYQVSGHHWAHQL
jgi:hypothetical protein